MSFVPDAEGEEELSSVPPELPDNRILLFIKDQPKSIRIAALSVAGACVVLAIILSYASLFHGHKSGYKSRPAAASVASTKSAAAKPTAKHATGATAGSGGTAAAPSVAKTLPSSTLYPASILNLTNWKVTLPTGDAGDPNEITQPQLANYSINPYFRVNSTKNGVLFQAPVNGVTTSGSSFPRSELREMTDGGAREASWSTTKGTNTMTVREAITHLPAARPQVVAAQIHGPSAYLILIRLNGSDLFVEDDGKNVGNLNSHYTLGTVFTLQITATGGHIYVYYNGAQKVNTTSSSSGDYFKAGCYTQANTSYGGSPTDYGQTIIYGLSVSHT